MTNETAESAVPPLTGGDIDEWMTLWRLTSTELASKLGVTPATLWNWRAGKAPIKPWVRLALAGIEQDERARLSASEG